MIKTYESYAELAEAMCAGEGILHLYNCAQHEGITDPCGAWQRGVTSFAEWLDHIGCKVAIPDKAEDFYNFMSRQHLKALLQRDGYAQEDEPGFGQ